jgi:hypothetical protein
MKKAVLLLSIVFLMGFMVNAQTEQAVKVQDNPNAPEITFEKTVHDYGTIEVGSDGTSFFEFTNTGKEPLILQKPRSSCGCTVPTWPQAPILPGDSEKIKVTYNTRRKGTINKTVTILSNAKNNPVVLRIKGKVIDKAPEEMPEKETSEGAPVSKK